MVDRLIALASRLGHWSYLLIFLGATLEASAFLGLIVPGETLVLAGGFLAAQGLLDVGDLVALVAIGAVLGDSIGYELGRHLGRTWLLHYGRFVGLRPHHLERADAFFGRHGGKTVFFGRFIGVLRALAPFVAGSAHMPYRQFLLFNAVGGVCWAITFVLLGYFLGASWQLAERWIGRASAIVAAVFAVVVAMGWLWRWLVRHEQHLKTQGAAILAHPRVMAYRRRFARPFAFLQARLSPGEYLGLHLTVGVLILVGASWLFGGIAEDVLTGDPLTVIDLKVSAWLHAHSTPAMTGIMLVISDLGSAAVIAGVTLSLSVCLLWRRQREWATVLVLAVPGGMLLNVLLKQAFHRGWSVFQNPIVTLTTYGFPSDHAMAATVLYGAMAAWAVWEIRRWRWCVLVGLLAALLVALIDFSRVYLGLHYLSDVLGGSAAGVAWLALCITAVDTVRRRRDYSGRLRSP